MSELRFDLNLFRVFDAIYSSGSLTRAAESLHLTQPAVSHALTRLRGRFNDPLFRREGRGVVPTARAHALAPDVRKALSILEAGIRSATQFDPATSRRRFAVGMRDSMELTLLAPLLLSMQREAPGVTLASVRFSRQQMERELARGALDLVLDVPQPLGPDTRMQRVGEGNLCVVMRQGHPLAGSPLTMARWLSAGHIVVSSRPTGLSMEDVELQRQGLHRNVVLRCQNYPSACEVVARSDLMLTLPGYIAIQQSVIHALHVAEPPGALPQLQLQLQLYWHHAANEDAGNCWLRTKLFSAAAAHAPQNQKRSAS